MGYTNIALKDKILEMFPDDECMDGIKCVYLGVQISQFINNFELIEEA